MKCVLIFIGGLAVGILTGIGIHAAGDDEDDQSAIDEGIEEVVQEEIPVDEDEDNYAGGFGGFMPLAFRSFLT